ncbi:Self-incompatibility protein [Melia azedarach]|uniref:Self-incompatibility protein n=1 Tax=Melia azedarach TaxID=155640 RepID=A0ACC1YYZ8_MELAZ|nr:Self-incompatibility protein [Melia azedarach]
MTSFNLNSLLLFFVLTLAVRLVVSPIPTKTWHVHVVNNLSKVLFVHCKSGDDDLGEHNVTTGAEFAWKFKEHFFQRTLFWCYVSRPEGFCSSFDVFWNEDSFLYRCNYKECFWIVRDRGIYLKNIPEGYEEPRHKWNWPPC